MQEQLIEKKSDIEKVQSFTNPFISNNSEVPSNSLVNNPYNLPLNADQLVKANQLKTIPNLLSTERNNEYPDFEDRINVPQKKQKSMHIRDLLATVVLFGGIAIGLYLYLRNNSQLPQSLFILIQCGSYIVYLFVACQTNKMIDYLKNIDEGQHFEGYYDQVRQMVGHFDFYAECYHYQTRHHTRYYKDQNGNDQVEYYTTQEKVVTHTATESLTPSQTHDESGRIGHIISQTNLVFIHFFVDYRFLDSLSSQNFENAYSTFKANNTKDEQQIFTMNYNVPGLIQRKAFYVGNLNCKFKSWFYVFGSLGLIWPYSLWVESRITRFDVHTKKVLKV